MAFGVREYGITQGISFNLLTAGGMEDICLSQR